MHLPAIVKVFGAKGQDGPQGSKVSGGFVDPHGAAEVTRSANMGAAGDRKMVKANGITANYGQNRAPQK